MHNDTDSAAQGAQIDAFEILSVIVYGALLRMLKAEQQAHEGRLPAACLADYRDILSRAYLEREIVDDERHIFGISERNIVHFYSAREARQHLLAVRNLRNGVKKRLYHCQHRFYLRDIQRNSREGTEGSRNHTVCGIEGVVIGDGNAGFHRHGIHHKRSDKADGKRYDGIELDESGRTVLKLRALCIEIAPSCKGALLGARKLYFLYSRDERICHAAFFAGELHQTRAQFHLYKRRDDGKYHCYQYDKQCGHDKHRSICKNLRYVDERKHRGQSR